MRVFDCRRNKVRWTFVWGLEDAGYMIELCSMNKTYLLPLLAFLSGVIIYSIFLLSESESRNFLTHSADSLMIILTFVGAGSIYGLCTILGIYKTLDVESFN